MTTALQTVQEYQRSIGKGTDEWQNLLADDVVFHGPLNEVNGRKAYVELANIFFSMVKNYRLLNSLGSENHAAVEGRYTVTTPSGKTHTLAMAEWFEVITGQIQSIRIYFDAEDFRREFAAAKS